MTRLYRLLLRLYPPGFRRDVGEAMALDFEERRRRARERGGPWAVAALWPGTVADLAVTAALEWAATTRTTTRERGDPMADLTQDLRYAVRMLLKNPVFTAAAVVTLAVGIGLNAATFSVVHALLLRPLPGVEAPDELVQLYQRFQGDLVYGSNSIPHYRDLRDDLTGDVFESVAAWTFTPMAVSGEGESQRVMGMMVSANFFQTLGVRPERGRVFVPGEEDRGPGAHPVAVLGDGFWRERYGADPSVVGRTIQVNGHPFEVVGIVPADFKSPMGIASPPLYVPLVMQHEVMPGPDALEARGRSFMMVVARLADGVGTDRARERVAAYYGELVERHPESYVETGGITLVPQAEAGIHPMLRGAQVGLSGVMMGLVGMLLLIACVNVANLFLARARERRHEMGIRLSLGAGRGRVVRQLLTESLVFSAVAGGAGVALAFVATRFLSGITPPMEGPWAFDFRPDGTVLAFAVVVSVAAGVLFGLAPALQASRPATVQALRNDGGRGGGRSRVVSALVVAQVALSLVLLVSSGLFLRSLQGATRIDKGFDAANLLLASADPGLQGYGPDETRAFWEAVLERVRALPGVRSAAVAEMVPLGMNSQQTGVTIPGYTFGENERRSLDYNVAGADYFEAMGMGVVEGRGFDARDRDETSMVVNRRFAERFWPGESAVGRTVRASGVDWTVVGVVRDGKYNRLGEDPLPFMWESWPGNFQSSLTLHVRTGGDPAGLAGEVRRAVAALDPDLPVTDVMTMESHMGYALMPALVGGSVLGLFGAIGLFLAAVGIYGVMAYSVAQRRRELGIRVALGADRGRVVGMVVGEGLRLALFGAALGLAGALAASRVVSGLLYDVSALDPLTFAAVPLVLVAVAALAVYIPARRAAGVDPMGALRAE